MAMRFGLALSGGGLRGMAHIGVLKALHEEGLKPSWISGASAGAMVSGVYACGYTPQQMDEIARNMDTRILDVDYGGILKSLITCPFKKDLPMSGVYKGDYVEKLFRELTGGRLMREVGFPIAITAVDIQNGQTVVFTDDRSRFPAEDGSILYRDDAPLYLAIRASIAIPAVFRPCRVQGQLLVDGGVTDGMPVMALKKMGAPKVLAVNLGYSGQRRDEVDSIIEIGSQALDIMVGNINAASGRYADYVLNPQIYDVALRDVSRMGECIDRGYTAAISHMDEIKRALFQAITPGRQAPKKKLRG
jgi:NTE family protein